MHKIDEVNKKPFFVGNRVFQCRNCKNFGEGKTKAEVQEIMTSRWPECKKFEDLTPKEKSKKNYIVEVNIDKSGLEVKLEKEK